MSKIRVGIIGGGVGGIALATTLIKSGIETRLFERAPAFGDVGAGIQVTPNAVKVLHALGLRDGLRGISFTPQAIVGRDWKSGTEKFRTPIARDCETLYGAPFYHIHRADLHQLMASTLPPEVTRHSANCVEVYNTGNGAKAIFDDGSSYEADLIVAADGVRSGIRAALFENAAPKFTGNVCYRTVIPFDQIPRFVSPDSSFWFGPAAHIVTYYVRCGKAVNIATANETDTWAEESWSVRSSQEELKQAFAGWHKNLQQLFDRAENVFKWGLFDRDPMPGWTKDNITLLGDAAHPMLPFLSQGAAMAIEDGYVLGESLRIHGSDIQAALQAYEAERLPRTTRVQLESRERKKVYHAASRLETLRRDLTYKVKSFLNPHKSGIGTNWVYEYSATDFPNRIGAETPSAVAA